MATRTREQVEAAVPDDLRLIAIERDWPKGLLERMLHAGIPAENIYG